jgi:oligopeptide transport system ATP-binding protein
MDDKLLLLQVRDLHTHFHTPEGTIYAVNGISYNLHEGETLAVVGESGCGKSVSMMSILGLIPMPPGEIAGGSAVYQGQDLLKLSESELEHVRGKEIAMIFQDPMTSLNPVLTIGKQITEMLHKHMAMDQATASKRAVELLDWVGISDAARRLGAYPHQFSGGMRQRVMIAMQLACMPTILIADEPTTALDVTIQAQIVELVVRLREETGMAMIWITHDLGVVAGLADRVIVMYAGLILESAGSRSPAARRQAARPPAQVDPGRPTQPSGQSILLPLCATLRIYHRALSGRDPAAGIGWATPQDRVLGGC